MKNIENILEKLKEKERESDFWDFRNDDAREHVHSLIRYPAVMVPNMQKEIFNIILSSNDEIKNVLDPFMGSGTVLIEGLLNNLDCIGIDINPLAYLATVVKLNKYSIKSLKIKFLELKKRIGQNQVEPFNFDNIKKWYSPNVILALSRIRESICEEPIKKYRQFFWICFADISKQADNSRTSTFKLHIKTEKDIQKSADFDVLEKFYEKIEHNINAIIEFNKLRRKTKNTVKLIYGNSINILANKQKILDESIDLIISSPPYGDNATTITYGQYSVLPLRWIPLNDISPLVNQEVISTLGKIDKDSLGGKRINIIEEDIMSIGTISPTLHEFLLQLILNNQKPKAAKVLSFFKDYDKVLRGCSRVLKRDSYLVLTVGNRHVNKQEVYLDTITTDFAKHYGLELIYDFRRNISKNKVYSDTKAQNYKTIKKETILVFIKK